MESLRVSKHESEAEFYARISAAIDFIHCTEEDVLRSHIRNTLFHTPRRFGKCDCKREHWCGHCMNSAERGRHTRITEQRPICPTHGRLTAKDVITAYPEGHSHHEK